MVDPKLLASGAVVLLTIVLALSTRSAIQRMDLSPEQRRRTKNVVRYALVFFVLVGLSVVWAAELQSVAIVAVVATEDPDIAPKPAQAPMVA